MRVVYNDSYGGYDLPPDVDSVLRCRGHKRPGCLSRHHPALVTAVREHIVASHGDGDRSCCTLAIEDIDGDTYWIQEYDGKETVWTPGTVPWVRAR